MHLFKKIIEKIQFFLCRYSSRYSCPNCTRESRDDSFYYDSLGKKHRKISKIIGHSNLSSISSMKGEPIEREYQILGHQSIQTTMKYNCVPYDRMRDLSDKKDESSCE